MIAKRPPNSARCPRCGMGFGGFREIVEADSNVFYHKYCYELEQDAEHGE